MAMNKRGVFYLMVSTLFISVIIIMFIAYKQYTYQDRQRAVETRIMTINEFIKDTDFDSKRVIYVSGFRSLIALEDHVAKTGSYINNTNEMFRIAFYNGTINGTAVDILENSTYEEYVRKLNLIASRIGLSVLMNVTNITLYHDSPWTVNITVSTHVIINDSKGAASWEFDKDYHTSVSLINVRDPLYSVSTYGKVPNTIRITNITDFVVDTTNSTVGLEFHANRSLYKENTKAPSFLMRLSGNFSPSPYGIESIVYVPELIVQGVTYDASRSTVDYVFFTNITGYGQRACFVHNMPDWFKIDLNHTSTYEINKLNYTVC